MKRKNALFSSLGYVPPAKPIIKSRRQNKLIRLEAQKELVLEKEKRRKLHATDRVAWEKYKIETKEKIQELNRKLNG